MNYLKSLTSKDIQDIPDDDRGGDYKDSNFVQRTKIQAPPLQKT